MEAPFDVEETDRLLTTTRSVRKRLDLDREVPWQLLLDCLNVAIQAPSAVNSQGWRWLMVTDAAKRSEIARLYNEAGRKNLETVVADSSLDPTSRRIYESSLYLTDVLDRVPVHVIPCIDGRVEQRPSPAAFFGSIIPAVWSFMLALRSRGLGCAWTTLHLYREEAVAELLEIPYDSVTQVALLPVAYTVGDVFRPAPRSPVGEVTFWDRWGSEK